ncbi:MAG: type III-A CRISPR-associated protein Csm2 [Ignavibacteria bacterium]|nr:type III-A CRISPR-associated protein Csm2 [Ignavibacteria bacterium]
MPINLKLIDKKLIDAELFNNTAKQEAQNVAAGGDRVNKPTQLRRFYDEVVMWENKTTLHPDKFAEYLPFIRMINAKVAYAKGRNLVDERFVGMMNECLKQVECAETLRTFKLFMEAFMGFYKQERPKD